MSIDLNLTDDVQMSIITDFKNLPTILSGGLDFLVRDKLRRSYSVILSALSL